MNANKVFTIELRCAYAEWWRYNVELQCGAYDSDEQQAGFTATRQQIAEVGANLRTAPDKGTWSDKLTLQSVPCHRARFLIYIIPHTLPAASRIEEVPPFEITLHTRCDGKKLATEKRSVNPWCGSSFELTLE